MLGVIFFKSNHIGRHFCTYVQGVFPDFQGFCKGFHRFSSDFYGFCPDFHQIKTFGGKLAPPAPLPPTPLLHSVAKWHVGKITGYHILILDLVLSTNCCSK